MKRQSDRGRSESGSAGNIPCHHLVLHSNRNKSSSHPTVESSPAPRLQRRCFGHSPSGDSNSAEGKTCRGPGPGHPQETRWGLRTILQERKSRLCRFCRLAHIQNKIKQNIQLSLERRGRSRLSVTFIWAKTALSPGYRHTPKAARGTPSALRQG